MWSNPFERAALNCREMNQGDVREEIVVGNACRGNQVAMEVRRYYLVMQNLVEPSS